MGTVDGFGGDQDNKETFFIFTSYNVPTSVYRYDVLANKIELVRQPKVKFDPEQFRRRAGVLQEQRRHAGADDPHLSQGPAREPRVQARLPHPRRQFPGRRCSTATAATTSR